MAKTNDLKCAPRCFAHHQRKNYFYFGAMDRLRAFHCSIFTGGVVAADGICSAALLRPGKGFISDGKVSDKTVKSADALAPPRGAVAQRLRGFQSAEPEKTVKRSSRRTGVNLQFFPVQPTSLGLSRACSPFLTGCGPQHPLHALGGTCVLLAAAPTTPPCFRRWRWSSLLHCGVGGVQR